MSQNLVAAIELSSRMVTAVVGRKEPDGALNILAAEREPSQDFIRRGKIYNPDKMGQCVKSLVTRLEAKLDKKITQMYVGIGGMGLHSVQNKIVQNYTESTKISQEIVDSIMDSNRAHEIQGYEILDVIPLEYRMGNIAQLDPVGIVSNQIEGNFINLVTSPVVREMIETSFRTADMRIADDLVITANPLADMILTDSEKRSGCVFLDMGAETTTVAVYNGAMLRFMSVIPLGGHNVTNDLVNILHIPEAEAKVLKREYGRAYINPDGESETASETIQLSGGNTETRANIEHMIEARMSEILQNVAKQIDLALVGDESNELLGGIVVTGCAATIKDLIEALTHYTKVNKVRVVTTSPVTVRCGSGMDFVKDGHANGALAIMMRGTMDCVTEKDQKEDIFTGPTEDEIKELTKRVKTMVEQVTLYFEDLEEMCKKRKLDDAVAIVGAMKDTSSEIQEMMPRLPEDSDVYSLAKETVASMVDAEQMVEDLRNRKGGKSKKSGGGGWWKRVRTVLEDMVKDPDEE